MKANHHQKSFWFIIAMILSILACGVPGVQTSTPPTIVPVVITATQPSPAQNVTGLETPTITPTAPDLGPIVNFGGGGTATPTSSPTPTPTLPDFDPVINFGGGGGGDMDPCAYPGYQPAVFGNPAYGMYWQRGILCAWGAGFGLPFTLKLISPDSKITLTGNFSVDQRTWNFDWQGNAPNEFNALAAWTDNGTRIDIDILWPFDLPTGNWQMIGEGDGLNAHGSLNVEEIHPQIPRILAYDARHTKDILPVDKAGRHSVQPNPDGSINVMGKNFPGNTTVYLLVYQEVSSPEVNAPRDGTLIYKQSVVTNASGYLESKIPVSLDPGKKYLLIGVDVNTPLKEDHYLNFEKIGVDPFFIKSSVAKTSEIDGKYNSLGGANSFLGQPTEAEQTAPDGVGRYRHYQGGSIYWSPSIGAYEVHGRIRDKWAELGWEKSFLGYPTTDESTTPDGIGRYNHFQGGSIYWAPNTDAHEVHGRIRDKWAELGWEQSFLGYPLMDESTTPDGIGRYNHFQGGSIYWTPNTDAHEVHGLIRDKWAELGWEKSCLGYPVSDEEPSSAGWARQSRFQYGIIKWSPEKGTQQTCY